MDYNKDFEKTVSKTKIINGYTDNHIEKLAYPSLSMQVEFHHEL